MTLNLKHIVSQKITNEIFKHGNSSTAWRVLVLDHFSTKMLSACCRIHDLTEYGITLVENISKKREPLPQLEAVYFVTPCEESVNAIINDFFHSSNRMYLAAHIFFTEACPDILFERICKAKISKCIKTLKEVNIAFVAYESQVFHLDNPKAFHHWYGPDSENLKSVSCERIAEQLATLCASLGEYPAIRYSKRLNESLARSVQEKLDAYKADDPSMGAGPEKSRSQLIILDRSIDCVSPLLHELTMQAMVYDLLPIENDTYKYNSSGAIKESLLDENDNLWKEFRHEHIADVSDDIKTRYNKFKESKMMISGDAKSMGDLSQMIKKMPQFRKELSKFATHFQVIEDCLELYNSNVHKLCNTEQDLAIGLDADGEKIRNQMDFISPILLQKDITNFDKMRIISLYLLSKNSMANLDKLALHSELTAIEKTTISNFTHLGVNAYTDSNDKVDVTRKNRTAKYKASRWTPIVKDIMEDAIENTMNSKANFPFLKGARSYGADYQAPMSARYGQFNKEKNQKVLPRLIVFIVGGMCYSEIRSAYEVTKALKTWEVVIGSTEILTPESFLANLSNLG